MTTHTIIATHPDVNGHVNAALVAAIDAALACMQSCSSCADACLAENKVAELRQCIRLNLDCADVCGATARLATRRTGSNTDVLRQALDVCITACRVCGDECERHAAHHEHCRICAQACRECARTCEAALPTV